MPTPDLNQMRETHSEHEIAVFGFNGGYFVPGIRIYANQSS